MADLTIMQAIAKIEGFKERVAKGAEASLRAEFARHNDSGYTASTLYSEIQGSEIFVGYPVSKEHPGAYYVRYGRGEVKPVTRQALAWNTPKTGAVITMRAKPFKGDDYITRAINDIRAAQYYF